MTFQENHSPVPITSYVVKVATLCNINCSYCYEYNMGDHRWKKMPKFISKEIVNLLASRIADHCKTHDLNEVYINFHGGEPLLYGVKRTKYFLETFTQILKGICIHWGIQTNGLLLSEDFVKLFSEYGFSLGLSLDGNKEANDQYRVDFSGRGTYERVMEAVKVLDTPEGENIFAGILSVINIEADPVKCFYEVLNLGPKSVDFLLPHFNWDNLPPTKKEDVENTAYADWYISIFDLWFKQYSGQIQIRTFEEIIQHLADGRGTLETMGLEPVSLLVITANGDMEGVDTLKSIPGQQVLNLNITNDAIDKAMNHDAYRFRTIGEDALHETCKTCEFLKVCGGGYIPHRWSAENQFNNPSVYCSDLKKLITHIKDLVNQLIANRKEDANLEKKQEEISR